MISFSSGRRTLKIIVQGQKKKPLFYGKRRWDMLPCPILEDEVLAVVWVTIMVLRSQSLRDHLHFWHCKNEDREAAVSAFGFHWSRVYFALGHSLQQKKSSPGKKDSTKYFSLIEKKMHWIRNPKIGHEALRASYSAEILNYNYYNLKGGLQDTSVLKPWTHL